MFSGFIANLRLKLEQPLPGPDIQFEMAHVKREKIEPYMPEASAFRPSAVLVLLYPGTGGETTILLIERVTYNGHHSGQIALPGGKQDPEDEDLQATAMREFFEETGSSQTPEVIGKLSPIYIPVSRFMVQPYIAYLNERPEFNINPDEVAQLIEWPFSELVNPLTVKETVVEVSSGLKLKTPYFDIDGKVLWGATAMILHEMKWMMVSK